MDVCDAMVRHATAAMGCASLSDRGTRLPVVGCCAVMLCSDAVWWWCVVVLCGVRRSARCLYLRVSVASQMCEGAFGPGEVEAKSAKSR